MFHTSVSLVLGVRHGNDTRIIRCQRLDGDYDIPGGLVSPPQTLVSGLADRLRLEVGLNEDVATAIAERAQLVCVTVNYTTGTISLVHGLLLDAGNPLAAELERTPFTELHTPESAGAAWVGATDVVDTIMEPLRERVAFTLDVFKNAEQGHDGVYTIPTNDLLVVDKD